MRRIITLTFFITFVFTSIINAQTKKGDLVPGFIINKSGKKIEGKVVVGNWVKNQLKVRFIKRGTSSRKTYRPKDLKGYGFHQTFINKKGEKTTRLIQYDTRKANRPPRLFGPRTVFMQKEVSGGHYQLYCYYIEVRNNPATPYIYTFFIEDKKGKSYKISEKNFSRTSRRLFRNYRALSSRVGRKNFKLENLDRMVEDYNYWVYNKHDKNEYKVARKQK